MCRLQMSNMMASLPLAGVKPCPRRWLIRAESRRRRKRQRRRWRVGPADSG